MLAMDMDQATGGSADRDAGIQRRRAFNIYSIYRLILACILLISYFYRNTESSLGAVNPALFEQLCLFYLGFSVLTLALQAASWRPLDSVWYYAGVVVIDVLTLVTISYTCGGVSSGMAHLVMIPVAAGSVLFQLRLSTFFAAVASLAAIYSEVYGFLSFSQATNYYFQAGILGLQLFMLSLGLQYLGSRIRQKDHINRQQAASIQALQAINQQVIERMQTGIVVVDQDAQLINCNSSALRMLYPAQGAFDNRQQLPAPLQEQLDAWLTAPGQPSTPFRLYRSGPEIMARFTFLPAEPRPHILIFLEDHTQISSRAHHLKLMSLGRLTASIAHEIRNPLSAISHACQLLEESELIDSEDRRLLSIVHTHTSRMDGIIQNILSLSRQQSLAPQQIDLVPWMTQFCTRFANGQAEAVDLSASFESPSISIRFGDTQLEQLLINLCENGLRHSQQQCGSPVVRLHGRIDMVNGNAVLDVIDEGPGVPEDLTEQIFEPFFTTESTGTGLGLFICKEICEANLARLFFCRTAAGKSCFRISFAHPDRLFA